MKISDFLSPAHVMIDVRASDKSRLLEQLSTEAAAEAGLAADEVVTEIAKREELGSTGVGNGVALPHARLTSLKTPFAFSPASATASTSTPSTASRWTSSFCCCFRRRAIAPRAMHSPASPAR